MNRKEKHIKSRLERFEIDDNQIDAIDLWNAIEPELLAPKKKSRRRWIFLLFSGILAIGGLFVLIYEDKPQNLNSSINYNSKNRNADLASTNIEQIPTLPSDNLQILNSSIRDESKNQNADLTSTTSDRISSINNKKNISDVTNPSLKNTSRPKNSIANLSKSELLTLADNIDVQKIKRSKTAQQKENQTSKKLKESIETNPNLDKSIGPFKNNNGFQLNNRQMFTIIPLDLNIPLLKQDYRTISTPSLHLNLVSANNNHIEIGLFGGTNTLLFDYGSAYSDRYEQQLSQVNSSTQGVTFGTQISYLIGDKFIFNTGLEFHQLFYNLKANEITYQQRIGENELIKSWENLFSGKTIRKEYGNAILTDTLIRNISQYTKFNRLSLPMSAGIRLVNGPFSFDLLFGISLNRTSRSTGLQFTSEEKIVEVAKKSFFTMGFHVESRIHLDLGHKYFIFLSPKWSYGNKLNYTSESIKHFAHQLNLNIGVGYTFR